MVFAPRLGRSPMSCCIVIIPLECIVFFWQDKKRDKDGGKSGIVFCCNNSLNSSPHWAFIISRYTAIHHHPSIHHHPVCTAGSAAEWVRSQPLVEWSIHVHSKRQLSRYYRYHYVRVGFVIGFCFCCCCSVHWLSTSVSAELAYRPHYVHISNRRRRRWWLKTTWLRKLHVSTNCGFHPRLLDGWMDGWTCPPPYSRWGD